MIDGAGVTLTPGAVNAKSTQTNRLGASCGLLGYKAFAKNTDSPSNGPEALTVAYLEVSKLKKVCMEAGAKRFVFGTTVRWRAFSYGRGPRCRSRTL